MSSQTSVYGYQGQSRSTTPYKMDTSYFQNQSRDNLPRQPLLQRTWVACLAVWIVSYLHQIGRVRGLFVCVWTRNQCLRNRRRLRLRITRHRLVLSCLPNAPCYLATIKATGWDIQQLKQMDQQTYGFINIYYGTTGGNSRALASHFKEDAKSMGFLPILCSLGDFDHEQFLSHRLCVFFISTYGQGGPTEDSARFLQWMKTLEEKPLEHMSFVLFGLGNSSFEFFCGMSKKVKALLLNLGARELIPTYFSDANVQEPSKSFNEWKTQVLPQVIKELGLKKITITQEDLKKMTKKYDIKILPDELYDWDLKDYEKLNLCFQIKKYLQAEKAEVLEVREIRKSCEQRSTLYVRIKTNLAKLPACNIQIYPQNVVDQQAYKGTMEFQGSHTPFPPMPIKDFMKLVNVSSKPTKSFVQEALYLSKSQQIAKRYAQILDSTELWDNSQITSEDIVKELDLGIQHQASLGINLPRVYTLAGWKEGQVELVVSLFIKNGKMGLTSRFLKSRPKFMRIKVLESSFNLQENPDTPLIMIANGSGIAPFRSIIMYYLSKSRQEKIRPLQLYYGCQKQQEDYYFKQEWEQAEKQGLIKLHIATSREGEKLYVQGLMKKNIEQISKHVLQNNSTFYVCGSTNMDKDIHNIFVSVFKEAGLKPFAAMNKVKDMIKNKRIVKEVYG